ncbi:MAG: WYL domain-containing protein [bacterium]|nr:WYL domain-containing protein [bacterium]
MDCPAKLYSLIILSVLKLYSDRQHPLTSENICQKLLSDASIHYTITPKTVRTQLMTLYDFFLSGRDYFMRAYGGMLCCLVRKNDGSDLVDLTAYEECEEAEASAAVSSIESPKKTRYYYWEPVISREEWILFQNMILCSQYLTVEQTRDLYNLTEQMKNPENPLRYSPERNRMYKQKDINIFQMLSLLQEQITKKQRIFMQYGEYRDSTKLSPRGTMRLVNPYAILSTNGYLYLIATPAGKPDRITNFRIDRIMSLSLPDAPDQVREDIPIPLRKYFPNADKSFLDAPLYRNEHPVMYSGEIAHVKLLCRPSILNNVIDDFGLNLRIETKHAYKPSDWLLITANASLLGTKVFCVHHCSQCIVLSPEKLKDAVVKELQEGIRLNLEGAE